MLDSFAVFWKSHQLRSDSQARLHQIRSASRLGRHLAAARADARLTQAELAALASCSVRSVWQAERGLGRADLFIRLAAVIGKEIAGRSLPPGDHLGVRLLALRRRTRTSRRQLSANSGVSPTSIAELEAGRLGHLAVLERVGKALGAGLALVPLDGAAAFFAGAALSSAWDAWATPYDVLERLYRVVDGGFDLDPCSPGRGGCRVRARMHYDEDDNGLSREWHGAVYMNPPYGRTIRRWTAKARGEVEAGRASVVVGLLPARTDTRWWHADIAGRADTWLLRGRLAFGDGEQPAPFASALVIWPPRADIRNRMLAEFPDAWSVPAPEVADGAVMDLAAD